MIVHITLVGGQTAPVYAGIVHSGADKVYLVCSKQSRLEADRIAELVGIPCSIVEMHPTDVSVIFSAVSRLYEEFKDDDVLSLNLVGGTKPWSLVFFSVFKDRPSTRFELVDQNNQIWDFSARQSEDLPPVDIDTVFKLYGNPLVKSRKFKDYTGDDKKVAEQVWAFRRRSIKAGYMAVFNRLTAVLREEWDKALQVSRSGRFEDVSGGFAEWDKDAGSVSISLADKQGLLNYEFHSPHAVSLVFNSGWFEFKIAAAVSKWKQAREIRLNCLFPLSEKDDANIKNEVDVVVSTGKKLFFFECKTSLRRPLDVDKFASVVKNYGGMGTKGILVTEEPLKEQAVKKCEEYGLLHFCVKEHMAPGHPDYWRQALISYLESEVDSINKK